MLLNMSGIYATKRIYLTFTKIEHKKSPENQGFFYKTMLRILILTIGHIR